MAHTWHAVEPIGQPLIWLWVASRAELAGQFTDIAKRVQKPQLFSSTYTRRVDNFGATACIHARLHVLFSRRAYMMENRRVRLCYTASRQLYWVQPITACTLSPKAIFPTHVVGGRQPANSGLCRPMVNLSPHFRVITAALLRLIRLQTDTGTWPLVGFVVPVVD